MMIDKVGGLSPSSNHQKTKEVQKDQTINSAQDRVNISKEASQAADLARIADIVSHTEDPERVAKLNLVRDKLARHEYDNLNEEQAQTITASLMQTFFG